MNKSPIFKAFALFIFISGVFGLVTCKQLLVNQKAKQVEANNGPPKKPDRSRMFSSKSMPPSELEMDLEALEESSDSLELVAEKDTVKQEKKEEKYTPITDANRDSFLMQSPFVRPDIKHTEEDKERARQIRRRASSSKSFVVYISEEELHLLASFDFLYAFGIRSYAQALLDQLTRHKTHAVNRERHKEFVDSLKKAIEKENWKPVRKDSISVEQEKE